MRYTLLDWRLRASVLSVDLDDTVVFCDAYFEQRSVEFYAFPRGGEVAGEMRYRKRFLERKACVDLADIRRKKGPCARGRFVPSSVCAENALRLGRGSRFVTPVISNRSPCSLYFAVNFMERRGRAGSIANEIRKLSHDQNIKSSLNNSTINKRVTRSITWIMNILIMYFDFVTYSHQIESRIEGWISLRKNIHRLLQF